MEKEKNGLRDLDGKKGNGEREMEREKDKEAQGVVISDVENSIKMLFDVLMGDVATGHYLKLATCAVSEDQYWSQHIGDDLDNECSELYGHLSMTCGAGDEASVDAESSSDEEEREFGM